MKHFQVTVSCQGVRSSLAVILDKDLEREQIRKICEACVKDNYEVEITRRRDCSDVKWVTLGEMIHKLTELRLHKIEYKKISMGMGECHCGQLVDVPSHINPVHAIIRSFSNGEQIVYINLKTRIEYLKVDYAAYAAELNKQDLKLSFSPYSEGIFACLPKDAKNAKVVIDCPFVRITWTEYTNKYGIKEVKTEL